MMRWFYLHIKDELLVNIAIAFFAYSVLTIIISTLLVRATGGMFDTGSGNCVIIPLANYVEYIYWTSTTFTTLGYGDITPCTGITKILSMLISVLGITHMATFISIIVTAPGIGNR